MGLDHQVISSSRQEDKRSTYIAGFHFDGGANKDNRESFSEVQL